MKKIYFEVLGALAFVFIATFFVYGWLSGFTRFWSAQFMWNCILVVGWTIIATGYYMQGFKVHKLGNVDQISPFLPESVFVVQCILFVKGIFYHDWALIYGALIVNSGVIFCIYQVLRVKRMQMRGAQSVIK
ncbi:MAG: hypothetical protein WCK91_00535 [bacterium]